MTSHSSKSESTKVSYRPQPGENGIFADVALPRLLVDLYRVRFSGALEIERGNTKKRIVFEDGAPVLSDSNLANETLGMQLLDQGTITKDDHERVSSYMKTKKCKEGVALLALELLKPKSLFLALKEQVRRRVLEAFAWSDGGYRLTGPDEHDTVVASMRSDPLALIREGLISHWTPDRLLTDLTEAIELFPVRTKYFDEAQRRLAENDDITEVFDRIDGSCTLGAAIGSRFNSLPVLASLWILQAGKWVRFEQTAAGAPGAAGDSAFDPLEIEVVSQASAQATASAATDSNIQKGAGSKSPSNVAAGQMREQVLTLFDGLEAQSLYELIGVGIDATDREIRKAYFAAAKRFHPDALTHLGLTDIKNEAATVFARIAEANDVLRDPAKRADYDARGDGSAPDIDTAALAQAETFFRKGEILIRMGDFRGALEYVQSAVELWPDECAYQSGLGWALYKQPQSDHERALVHLEKAVELDDSDAVALFRLGMVVRASGDNDRGSEFLARANALDPKTQ